MQIMRLLACAAALSAAGGCATIIRGTEQDFVIESSPPGAEATLSTGQSCVTPCTLNLPRKTDFDVTFNMEGYESGTAHVTSGWSRGGTQTFVVGNLILGGLVGMGVDASTGAARDLWPNPLTVTLVPTEPETASADAALTALATPTETPPAEASPTP